MPTRLNRMLGMPTAWLVGLGVAIGSGIFRTPGDIAAELHTPALILLAWLLGGAIALMQALVSAELVTRFPRAGGEYVFLKQAYGDFVAFFFGWAYTVFILGGALATIALALGDFACQLVGADAAYAGRFAALTIVIITGVNVLGLRAGADTQNTLTALKVMALLGLIALGLGWGAQAIDWTAGPTSQSKAGGTFLTHFLTALVMVHWSYDGTTDAVKLSEEIRDVRRALPRALLGSALTLTMLYVLVNVALLRMLPLEYVSGQASPLSEAAAVAFGDAGRRAMLGVGILVCLGTLMSTLLAAIRVTFALARDGLTFRFLAWMSKGQAPIPAMLIVAGFALVLVSFRDFRESLGIYYFASAILFGLNYASLVIFRARERAFPSNVYRCPAGPLLAIALIAIQAALAVNIALEQRTDVLWTAALLAFFAALYFVWKRAPRAAK